MVVKKNNLEWLDDNKKLHFSVERLFTRDGDFDKTALNQEGAFVDILRVVNLTFFLLMKSSLFFSSQMFRTKFNRIADPLFYILGGNNAFNYSKAVDKLEGYISPIFAAISARMQGPNKDQYGFIYRVSNTIQINI